MAQAPKITASEIRERHAAFISELKAKQGRTVTVGGRVTVPRSFVSGSPAAPFTDQPVKRVAPAGETRLEEVRRIEAERKEIIAGRIKDTPEVTPAVTPDVDSLAYVKDKFPLSPLGKRAAEFLTTRPSAKEVYTGGPVARGFGTAKAIITGPFYQVRKMFEQASKDIAKAEPEKIGLGLSPLGEKAQYVSSETIRGLSTFIPTTPAGQVAIFGGIGIYGKTQRITKPIAKETLQVVRGGVGTYFGYEGGKGALDPEVALGERIASGVMGIGGVSAGAFEIPFVQRRIIVRQQKGEVKQLVKGLEKTERFTQAELESIGRGLKAGVELQLPLRKVPDVPITKPVTSIIPRELTTPQKEAFASVIFTPKAEIFGGQALALRGLRKTADIDIAVPRKIQIEKLAEVEGLLKEVSPRGTIITRTKKAVGIAGEKGKAFDIEQMPRIREFKLKEKPIITKEGVRVSKLSEQYSRAIHGTLELRKGGKDVAAAIVSGRALIKSGIKKGKRSIPIVKQFREIKLRKLEIKLTKLEKGARPLSKLFEEGYTLDIPKRLRLETVRPITERRRKRDIKMEMIEIKTPRITPKRRPTPSRITPSRITPSRIKPSRIMPSRIKPSRIPSKITPSRIPSKITPSKLKPSKITPSKIIPSIFRRPTPSRITPSKITTPRITPKIIPLGKFKLPRAIIKERKRRRKRARGDRGISETFVQRQLLLKLPKEITMLRKRRRKR